MRMRMRGCQQAPNGMWWKAMNVWAVDRDCMICWTQRKAGTAHLLESKTGKTGAIGKESVCPIGCQQLR